MITLSNKFRLVFAALVMGAAVFIADAAYAHDSGGHHSGGGIVPVHGSPSMNGGVLVTHGNLKLPPPPVQIVRDHRPGHYPGCSYGYYRGGYAPCAPGGIIGGTPADPPYGGLPQGGTVRDHRH